MSTPEQMAVHAENVERAVSAGLDMQRLLVGVEFAKDQIYREAAMLFAGGVYPETYVLMGKQLDTLEAAIEARISKA